MNLVSTYPDSLASDPVNVLIVDDIQENLTAMEALLREPGLNLLCASSGAQALELLLSHEVALALLDVHMPEMDGFTLAELMRGSQRTRHVPIIFLTASPSDPVRAFKGYEAGAVDFLHKPIEPRVIAGKVRIFVELYAQRRLLSQRNADLVRALELNETMSAVLTHDLRTPLSVVTLCAEKLAMELPDDAPAKRTLGYLESSGRRMARMVTQLLDFSRIRSGGLRLTFARQDVAAVAEEALAEYQQTNPAAHLSLQCTGDTKADIDADRVSQILSNLLGNAIEHGGDAPVAVELDGTDAEAVRISVSNVGAIPDDLLPCLFEPFKGRFRASSGLGLGLYIADQFTRAHGGTLSARNEQGRVVLEARIARRNR